jgi:hypothetical protein
MRPRLATVAGLALAVSLTSAPAVLAQEGPEQAVSELMAAIEAKEFDGLAGFFCEEFAGQAADFDISGLASAFGADPSLILDAIILDTEIASLEVVSQSDTEAVVRLVGSLTTGLDATKLAPLAEAILAAAGQEVTPEAVEQLISTLTLDGSPSTIDIDEEITMSSDGAGGWVICDLLSGGDTSSPGASLPVDGGVPEASLPAAAGSAAPAASPAATS